ncbi:MAG: NusG domain II-containing protein [Hydrogeniiclostridium sp.]
MRNKLFRRADILLAFACLFLAAVFFLWSFLSPSGGIAVIEQNGIEVGRYVLSQIQKKEILQLPGEMNVQILLEPGAASFLSSDCPDQICVRTGKLTKPGEAAVCLPARVSLRIVSSQRETNGYDGITG